MWKKVSKKAGLKEHCVFKRKKRPASLICNLNSLGVQCTQPCSGPDPICMQETKCSVCRLMAVLQDKLLDVKHTAAGALNKLFPWHEDKMRIFGEENYILIFLLIVFWGCGFFCLLFCWGGVCLFWVFVWLFFFSSYYSDHLHPPTRCLLEAA